MWSWWAPKLNFEWPSRILSCHHQACKVRSSWGVWGHAPRKIFKIGVLKLNLSLFLSVTTSSYYNSINCMNNFLAENSPFFVTIHLLLCTVHMSLMFIKNVQNMLRSTGQQADPILLASPYS